MDRSSVCGGGSGLEIPTQLPASPIPSRYRDSTFISHEYNFFHALQFTRRGTIFVLVTGWGNPRVHACIAVFRPEPYRCGRRRGPQGVFARACIDYRSSHGKLRPQRNVQLHASPLEGAADDGQDKALEKAALARFSFDTIEEFLHSPTPEFCSRPTRGRKVRRGRPCVPLSGP